MAGQMAIQCGTAYCTRCGKMRCPQQCQATWHLDALPSTVEGTASKCCNLQGKHLASRAAFHSGDNPVEAACQPCLRHLRSKKKHLELSQQYKPTTACTL